MGCSLSTSPLDMNGSTLSPPPLQLTHDQMGTMSNELAGATDSLWFYSVSFRAFYFHFDTCKPSSDRKDFASSTGYINCICAPVAGPKGLAGLITGWLYITVGCVIIMEPICGGIVYATMPVGVVAGKAMTDGAMVAGFHVVEGAVLGCQLLPPVSFLSPGWLQ